MKSPPVFGIGLDSGPGCEHYRSPLDIVAIQCGCHGHYYACYRCHEALTGSLPVVLPSETFDEKAVLCRSCGEELSPREYFSVSACPRCRSLFNPRCALHRHLYFGDEILSQS